MADWKSAIRDVKKALMSSSANGAPLKTADRPPATAVRQPSKSVVTLKQNARQIPSSPPFAKRHISAKDPVSALATKAKSAAYVKGRESENLARSLHSRKYPPTAKQRPAQETAVALPKSIPVPSAIKAQHRSTLTRHVHFKEPEAWVIKGSQTQIATTAKTIRFIDIVIGLDFGTSYTKAAVGLMDRIYPVSWDGISLSPNAYLLTSEYTVLSDGRAMIGQRPGASVEQVKRDLKLPFVNPGVSIASVTTACIFLALVLRYIRAWVFEHHGTKIGNAGIRWQLNLGAPSNGLEDGRLELAYQRLGNCAWMLSERPVNASFDDATDVVTAWGKDQRPTMLQDLSVRPEFVAQIAGYVQSPQRTPGLHALVDIGGGTMDVVTFIVHRIDEEDTFPFLVPSVKWLGTQMLYQNRLEGAPPVDEEKLPDELLPVLDATSYAAATALPEEHVKKRDVVMFDTVRSVVAGVFATTKARRYRMSEAWEKGLRTFLTGGGANASEYSNSIDKGGLTKARRIDLMPLPLHPRLADFTGDLGDYQRISVACGLAQDAFSLGRIIPAKEVEDDPGSSPRLAERPDRDDLYAR